MTWWKPLIFRGGWFSRSYNFCWKQFHYLCNSIISYNMMFKGSSEEVERWIWMAAATAAGKRQMTVETQFFRHIRGIRSRSNVCECAKPITNVQCAMCNVQTSLPMCNVQTPSKTPQTPLLNSFLWPLLSPHTFPQFINCTAQEVQF